MIGVLRGWRQQEVDPAAFVRAVGHFSADPLNAPELGLQAPRFDRGANQSVGQGRVDAHPARLAIGAWHLGLLPGPGQLAFGGGGVAQTHPLARDQDSGHRAGVGAVGGDGLAAAQLHIGQEAFVALQQHALR